MGRADCWLILKEEKRQLIRPLGELPAGQLPRVLAAAPRAYCRDSASQEQESQSSATVWQSRSNTVKEGDSEDLTLFCSFFWGVLLSKPCSSKKKI